MEITIKNTDGNIIFKYDCEDNTIKKTIKKAVSKNVSLNKADLSDVNLRGIKLYHADLSDANLSGSNLSKTNLAKANFEGANLKNADLQYSILNRTSFIGANRTSFIGADLAGVNFRGSEIRNADFTKANLAKAIFKESDLREANFTKAYLGDADFRFTCLSYTNFENSNLIFADFDHANLCKANFTGAKFEETNFNNAYVGEAENIPFIPMNLPEGEFIGWKKLENGLIAKLKILKDSKRSRATGDKCRCDKALVMEFQELDGSKSKVSICTNINFTECIYRVGEIVYADKWDDNRYHECSNGIHFFLDRESAVNYY